MRENVRLHEVLQAVVSELRETAAGRNVSIAVPVPPLHGLGDRRQLAVLFSNLIANAIAYSNPGGTVTVAAEEGADGITVTVSDQGIGIEAEALPRIFDEYYRTAAGSRFNKLSTGLGLAIVKTVAQNLGLRIRVTSEVGKGTRAATVIPPGRA